MTEAEILEQLTSNRDSLWSLMQYWTSVSFAVLIAAYLTKGKVSGFIVSIFLIFYAGFTLYLLRMFIVDFQMIRGGLNALEELSKAGSGLSPISYALLEHAPINDSTLFTKITGPYSVMGMFFLTLAYPVFCIFTSKK